MKMTRTRLIGLAVAALVLGAGAGAALYGIGAQSANDPVCAADAATLARMKPLAKGEVAAMLVPNAPRPVPSLSFEDGSGAKKSLADFRGKVVLFNLWATWCVPCRQEMPALDRLQARFGGADFEVVAVSIDIRDPNKPKKFLAEIGVKALPFWIDPSGKIFQELRSVGRAVGMPTTLLLDRSGCEIGYLPGPAEWDSPDAEALIAAALGK
jgi:thiol-disulfide isomerase/thioredoxin